MKKTLLSAVQPSSKLTLGNYLGAIRQWVTLQPDHECLFFAVDLHAITVPQSPADLRRNTYLALATYLAAGIDPVHSTVFVQSHVRQHAELAWILTCQTGMGELSRMTQYKDKSAKAADGDHIGVGLFAYPVLMAADILLYKTDLVPVGDDQRQHVQLARVLANRMNQKFGSSVFSVPAGFTPKVGARIMSLQNPERKMSKSDPEEGASVYLSDSNSVISKKVRRATTDLGTEVREINGPGVSNLLQIHAACTGKDLSQSVNEFLGRQYGHLKMTVADAVVDVVSPIRQRVNEIMADTSSLDTVLALGARRAREKADVTLNSVYGALGMIPSE